MGQQKREEDHGDLKKRRKTNTSHMGEVGGAEKQCSSSTEDPSVKEKFDSELEKETENAEAAAEELGNEVKDEKDLK